MWWILAGIGVVVVVLVAWYLSSTAGRLDRLHRRVDAARFSLDGALLRRSSVVSELASMSAPDPGTALLLADAAHDSRRAADSDDVSRGLVESRLSQLLAATFDETGAVEEVADELQSDVLTSELASACRRVEMSRRFLNDAVRACRGIRQQRIVGALGLAGHTAMPETFEMDATPPAGFGVR